MLPFAAYFGRLILSFHISSVSSPRKYVSKCRLVGKRSVSGTREHINEAQGVKAAQNPLNRTLLGDTPTLLPFASCVVLEDIDCARSWHPAQLKEDE
jgi:hypothetical protein